MPRANYFCDCSESEDVAGDFTQREYIPAKRLTRKQSLHSPTAGGTQGRGHASRPGGEMRVIGQVYNASGNRCAMMGPLAT